jgi:polar amino acid transport system substrate-binding protein
VVDLPTAFFISAVEIPNSAVVGQFATQGETEQFGLLFEEGNPLVDCANQAIEKLKADGTLQQIQDEWLSQAVSAPVIE